MIKYILTFLLGSIIGGTIGLLLMAIVIGGSRNES